MRLFFAIRFSKAARKALFSSAQEMLRLACADGFSRNRATITGEENFHLTLAFLGERREAESAVRAMRNVRFSPYRLRFGVPMKFGDILTIGIRDNGETLSLAKALRASLDDAGIAYDPKPPLPHVTLMRKFKQALPPGTELLIPDAAERVTSFCLMLSERREGRLVYTPIAETRADTGSIQRIKGN